VETIQPTDTYSRFFARHGVIGGLLCFFLLFLLLLSFGTTDGVIEARSSNRTRSQLEWNACTITPRAVRKIIMSDAGTGKRNASEESFWAFVFLFLFLLYH
jgi:hypothetical protein